MFFYFILVLAMNFQTCEDETEYVFKVWEGWGAIWGEHNSELFPLVNIKIYIFTHRNKPTLI